MAKPADQKPILRCSQADAPADPSGYILLCYVLWLAFGLLYAWIVASMWGESDQAALSLIFCFIAATFVALVAGSVFCVPTYKLLQSRHWLSSAIILCLLVVPEILIVTAFAPRPAILGAVVAYCVGLLLARRYAGAR